MVILDKEVDVIVEGSNFIHYKSFRIYKIKEIYDDRGEFIPTRLRVKIEHIHINCLSKVSVQCDICNQINLHTYVSVLSKRKKLGSDVCRVCYDLNAMKSIDNKIGTIQEAKFLFSINCIQSKINKAVIKAMNKLKMKNGIIDLDSLFAYKNKKRVIFNNIEAKHPHLIEEYSPRNKTPIYLISLRSKKYLKWVCPECSYEWEASIANRIYNKSECPRCHTANNASEGVKIIMNNLLKLNIQYETEFSFDDLRGVGGSVLRFDFAIFMNKQLICLIEYDGKHHFEPLNFSNTSEEEKIRIFERIKKHDELKNKYAKDKNIPLLRINYKVKHAEISNIINRFILQQIFI